MLVKKLLIVGLVVGILGIAGMAFAQSDADTPNDDGKPKSLARAVGQLRQDDLRRTLPGRKAKQARSKPSALATPQNRRSPRAAQADAARYLPTKRAHHFAVGKHSDEAGPASGRSDDSTPRRGLMPENAPLIVRRRAGTIAREMPKRPSAE